MENTVKKMGTLFAGTSAPRWYKVAVSLWGLLSLVGGGLVAFYILQESPSLTLPIAVSANVVQIILLGLLINIGLRYFSGTQLIKKFFLAFLLAAIVPIIFVFINSGGEMSLGVLMFIVLIVITVPQISFAILYGLARKIVPSRQYIALVLSSMVHVLLFALVLNFLFQN